MKTLCGFFPPEGEFHDRLRCWAALSGPALSWGGGGGVDLRFYGCRVFVVRGLRFPLIVTSNIDFV
jgi:hypothetical protein